jgi:hypothetical protein
VVREIENRLGTIKDFAAIFWLASLFLYLLFVRPTSRAIRLAKPILPSAHEEYCIFVTCTNLAIWWAA